MKFLIPLCFLFSSLMAFGQENEPYNAASANLQEQYDYLYKKSGKFQIYRVIEKVKINAFWKNVSDSLAQFNNTIAKNRNEIDEQAKSINSLNSEIESLNQMNAVLNAEKDGISFLGSTWSKSNYKMLMWSIVLGLLVLGILTFLRFRNSNAITKKTKLRLAEVESEFEGYKKSAISREQEIKRELQNYINKWAEIEGKRS